MNRLWVRFSLYFGLLIVVGVIITISLSRALLSDRVNAYLLPNQLRAAGGIVDTLGEYYREQGSWNGVEEFMRGVQVAAPVWSSRLDLILVDDQGRVVFQTMRGPGPNLPGNGPRPFASIPIEVDARKVGELQLRTGPGFPRPRAGPDIVEQLSRYLIWFAVSGGVIGIVFSIIASRSLTAPLSRLATAARDIGARNFNRRVELTGSDEMIEVAEAFNDMATQLQEAELLRRNLVADVAHELRTPLSVLQGNLRAILDDVYALDKEEITRLYTQTRLLSRLVNDLHDLAQAEAGQLSLNLQPTPIAELVNETVEAHAPIAEEAGVKLDMLTSDRLPPLRVDATRLAQVLHNLLANALRHTPAGGTITVRTALAGSQVEIAIQDTGEGIEPEHLPHVFDRFYRADRSRARDTGGAGLGLAIARAIVGAHAGRMTTASSGAGRGSTFTIALPVDE